MCVNYDCEIKLSINFVQNPLLLMINQNNTCTTMPVIYKDLLNVSIEN